MNIVIAQKGNRQIHDVEGYIDWLEHPERTYMSKAEVLSFITERLDHSCASTFEHKKLVTSVSNNPNAKCRVDNNQVKMKGKTRGKLVGYWQNEEPEHFKHMNSAIFTLLQSLQAEGQTRDQSVAIASQLR